MVERKTRHHFWIGAPARRDSSCFADFDGRSAPELPVELSPHESQTVRSAGCGYVLANRSAVRKQTFSSLAGPRTAVARTYPHPARRDHVRKRCPATEPASPKKDRRPE